MVLPVMRGRIHQATSVCAYLGLKVTCVRWKLNPVRQIHVRTVLLALNETMEKAICVVAQQVLKAQTVKLI